MTEMEGIPNPAYNYGSNLPYEASHIDISTIAYPL